MNKHTPGPWQIQDNTSDQYGQLLVESAEHGAVAICYTMEKDDTAVPFECIENARLISAAPELLDSLREIVAAVESGEVDGYSPSGDWFREAKAALAKAGVP